MTDTKTSDETELETNDTSLTVRRTFDASPERVFRAFTDPEELEQWYAPGEVTTRIHTVEPEPDGAFSLSFLDGANRTDIEGRFLEVVENERLVHTWLYPGETESLVTIEFEDVADGTTVVLTHENIGAYQELSDRENVEGYAKGWITALGTLGAVLKGRES